MIVLAIFTNPMLVFGAAAIGVTLISYLVLDTFFQEAPEDAKLERIKSLAKGENASSGNAKMDNFTSMLENVTPGLADMVKPKKEKQVDGLREQLNHAGFRRESAVTVFLGSKMICAAIALVLGGAFSLFTQGMTLKGLMYTCLLYTSPSPRDGLLSRMPSSA